MSNVPSDLPGPVGAPTGPTEGAAVDSLIADIPDASADSIVGAPVLAAAPVVADAGEVVLAVEAPWTIHGFSPSIPGCPPITRDGTPVPAALADQAISIGAANGVTIVKR